MAVYKDQKRGTWYTAFYYRDWMGNNVKKKKSGFKTKKEAADWELLFLQRQTRNLDMEFSEFIKLYEEDRRPRLKHNTWMTKEHIIKNKLLPYFGKRKMNEIKAIDIIRWQNEMISFEDESGERYSKAYLRSVQGQLSAIFNHAVRLYELSTNPVHKVGPIGGERRKEMSIWTKEQYLQFADVIRDKPQAYYAFEVLYWTGIRLGEMLALTAYDIDLEKRTIDINKSYQRIERKDYITDPKTEKSKRIITIPEFLCEELKEYLGMLYGFMPDQRIFQISKSYLHHELLRGAAKTGLDKIRVHDMRHSHVSMLIDMGFTATAIAGRMGHESIDITLHYAHMFPTAQQDMADRLDMERGDGDV